MAATWTPKFEGKTNAGLPVVLGQLFTYAAGTTTPLATFTDQSGAVQNTNPIQLDAAGRANVWLTPGTPYKFVLRGPSVLGAPGVEIWSQDNFAVGDPLGLGGLVSVLGGPNGPAQIGYQYDPAGQAITLLQWLQRYPVLDDFILTSDSPGETRPAFLRMSAVTGGVIALTGRDYYTATGWETNASTARKCFIGHPDARLLVTSPGAAGVTAIFYSDTSDKTYLDGRGMSVEYTNVPTVRTNHAIALFGATISNLEARNFRFDNVPNMCIAVFAGAPNTTATGSYGVLVENISSGTSLGDVVHIENFDTDVTIRGVKARDARDDVVAVLNYTGSGTAAKRLAPTDLVTIVGVHADNVRTSTISLGGVNRFLVDDVHEKAAPGFFPLTVKLTHDNDYYVGNSNGTIGIVQSDGAAKMLGCDTGPTQTRYQQNIDIMHLGGSRVATQAFSLSNGQATADGSISKVTIHSFRVDLISSAPGGQFFISKTNDCRVGSGDVVGGAAPAVIANNLGFSHGRIKQGGFAAGTIYPIAIAGNVTTESGELLIDATNCGTGPVVQSNTGFDHQGLWKVSGQSGADFVFGSNTQVSGRYREISNLLGPFSPTGGFSQTISYGYTVPAGGSAANPIVQLLEGQGLRYGVRATTNADLIVSFTDAQTNVFVQVTANARCG